MHCWKARSVITTRGEIAAGAVVNATAGWASTISKMAGLPLQIVTHQLQACVTEPLKPFLSKVIVSASLHVYVNQTDKGEYVRSASAAVDALMLHWVRSEGQHESLHLDPGADGVWSLARFLSGLPCLRSRGS